MDDLPDFQPYHCEQCDKRFTKSERLRSHMFIHTGDKTHSCSKCDLRFTNSSQLKLHMKTHNDAEKPFTCDTCGKAFRRVDTLNEHMLIHKEKTHACPVCAKLFKTPRNVRLHVMTHSGRRDFSCQRCGKQYTRMDALTKHMKTHTGDRQFSCEVCGDAFYQAVHLRRHLETHTDDGDFPCSICGLKFKIERTLKKHITSKHKKCSSCGKIFKTAEELARHRNEPHKCPDCGILISRSKDMIRHRRLHTGEAFPCQYCGKEFKRSYKRNEHYLTDHFDDVLTKDIESSIEASAKTASNPEQPFFPCTFCDKKYKRSSSLFSHILNAHPGNGLMTAKEINPNNAVVKMVYSCVQCDKNFTTTNRLYDHMAIEHTSIETIYGSGDNSMSDHNEGDTSFSHSNLLQQDPAVANSEHRHKKFACVICDCKYMTERGLQNHINCKHTLQLLNDQSISDATETVIHAVLLNDESKLELESEFEVVSVQEIQ